MRAGFVSESLVLGGIYLILNSYLALGGICLGIGVLGGCISFLFSVSLIQNSEKRKSDIFEISKSAALKLLQVLNEASQKSERTVH